MNDVALTETGRRLSVPSMLCIRLN